MNPTEDYSIRGALQARIQSSRLQRLSSHAIESEEESSRESIDVGTDSTFSTTASESEFELQTVITKARSQTKFKLKEKQRSRERELSLNSLDDEQNHWREDLDARVKGMGVLLPEDLDSMNKNGNNHGMGPKIKIISKAPWDEFEGMTTSPSLATLQPTRDVFDSTITPDKKEKENLKPKIISGRNRTTSVLTTNSRKSTRISEDSIRVGGGMISSKGKVNLGEDFEETRSISSRSYKNSSEIRPDLPVITTVKIRPKSPPLPLDLNKAVPSNPLSRSAPAHITTFSPHDLNSNFLEPTKSLPSPNSTDPHLANPLPSPNSSTVNLNGAGYQLISLEDARQREVERIAAASRTRAAMMPVQFIAGNKDGSESIHGEGKNSGSVSAASIKSLKSKRSGFLKRFAGQFNGVNSNPLPLPSPELPVVESFRALPDDYVHQSSPNLTVNNTIQPILSPPMKSLPSGLIGKEGDGNGNNGKVIFTSTPVGDNDQRIRKGAPSTIAPSLSLRPISMAFSAGLLPTGFLETVNSTTNSTTPATLTSTPSKKSRTPTPPDIQIINSSFYPEKKKSSTTNSLNSNSTTYDTPQSNYFSTKSINSPSSISIPLSPSNSSLISPSQSNFENSFHSINSPSLEQEIVVLKQGFKVIELELENQIKVLKLQLTESVCSLFLLLLFLPFQRFVTDPIEF